MRPLAIGFTLIALFAALAAAQSGDTWPPSNHSPHIVSFVWTPSGPERGQTVHVRATLQEADNVTGVLLRVCRVENYACRSPFVMAPSGASSVRPDYSVPVPWEPAFYRGVRTVGLAVILEFQNGTTEESPTTPWPAPAALPEGAGTYYFYDLPAEPAPAPSPAVGLMLMGLLAVVALRRPT